ncbi:MAG: MauE/DoxX family redox-associated membrane protein [Ignavibacteria bacterium]|jgi:hypothetical protein
MSKLFGNKNFLIFVRLVLGALFIYSSMDKLANMPDFAKVIHNYRLLPVGLENLLAIFLPWLEFITGLFLLIGRFAKGASFIYSAFLCIFIIALSQALIRGLDISCGCFSVHPSTTSEIWLRIIEDLVMLYFSVNLYRYTLIDKEFNFQQIINSN